MSRMDRANPEKLSTRDQLKRAARFTVREKIITKHELLKAANNKTLAYNERYAQLFLEGIQ